MRKLIFCLCCLLWAIPACAGDLELDLECLQEAYPGFITGTETDEAGHVWFLTKNGGRLLYDDGKMKSHAELLENADIEDAMRQPYPLEPERPDFAPDEEPGRIRCYPLLKALYGADQRSVERGIVRTLFGGKTKVRLAAPAAEAFQRIDAAWKLRPADPELNSYFSPIYGYFWRAIAKTNRLISIPTRVRIGNGANSARIRCRRPSPPPSSHSLRTTVSSGAESGSISTSCISSTAPN